MKSLKSTICVRVDKNEKELARKILEKEGISMTTLVNMAINEVIEQNGVPFQIKPPKPSKELLEALEEADQIIKDIESGKRKGYTNIDELFEAILKEDDEDED